MPTFRFGLPFAGFNSTIARHLVPRNQATADSRDFVIDPTDGGWRRRLGMAITESAGTLPGAGILDSKHSTLPRHLFEMFSPAMTDGYPIPALLLTAEETDADQVGFGTLAYQSSNDGDWHQMLDEFGSTHYPTNGASPGPSLPAQYLVDPMFYGHGAGGAHRGTFEFVRNLIALGVREVHQIGEELICPNYQGVPWKWKRDLNESTSAGTRCNRLRVLGFKPPLFPGIITAGTGSASAGPWAKNDQFFYSVAFMDGSGALSMPLLPRDINATLTGGLGRATLGTASNFYTHVTWTNIPRGPYGTEARVLLRSPKVDSSLAAYIPPDFSDLRVTAIIRDNVTTSYVDTGGNDVSLLADETRIRFDFDLPPCGRYIWTNDQHVFVGDTKPNPIAFFAAAWESSANGGEFNVEDSNAGLWSDPGDLIRITTTNLEISNNNAGGDPATNRTQIALSGKTIQQLVDSINATAVSGAKHKWVAQVAPGADGGAAATLLAPTIYTLTSCGTTNGSAAVTRVAGFADVAKGQRVYGTGIAAATYVLDATTTTLTLSANATATGTVTLTFANDYGDDDYSSSAATAADQRGWQRVFGPTNAAPMYFSQTGYLDKFPNKTGDVMFTGADPGHATYAPNNFYIGNRRTAPGAWGVMMGGAGLLDNCIVPFTRAVAIFRNTRAGKSGLDPDYRFEGFNESRGCVSPYSIISGNGWVGYLTPDGLVVCDGQREVVISLDCYQKDTSGVATGEWSYEMPLCEASAGLVNGDDFGFKAAVIGSQIHVSYRVSSAVRRSQVYDFTPSQNASGLAQVLKPDGTPYGWSCALTRQSSVFGVVRGSTGEARYCAVEGNAGSVGDGRVDQFDTGSQDNASTIAPVLYMAADLCDSFRKKSIQWGFALYQKNGTGLTLRVAKDKNRSNFESTSLASSGTDPFTRKVVQFAQASRSPREVIELSLTDNGTGSAPPKFWGVEAEVEILDSHT